MNILLTSIGRRTYMIRYFKEALGDSGKVFASNSIDTYSLHEADGFFISPSIYDMNYIQTLLDYCLKNNIKIILSLFDIDLLVLAKHKDLFFENGIIVVVSDEHVINICNDKWKTFSFLRDNNIKTVPSYLSIDRATLAIKNNLLDYPVILKPRWGMGSIGIYEANNEEELNVLYKKLSKEIFTTYLKFESNEDADNCILIQKKIEGREFGLDILNDLDSNYVTTVAKEKIAMRSGETDIAQIVDSSNFLEISMKISESLKHLANLDVDCFVTSKGEIYILEMNCRFGGQYPFSHLAGVNFPKQIIEWLHSNKTQSSFITPQIGLVACKDIVPVVFNNK